MNILNGTPGNDRLDGTSGDDQITLGAGNDVSIAFGGNDFVDGGSGDDKIYARSTDMVGDDGADHFVGGAGNDLLIGGTNNDVLEGGSGNDTLYGDEGNDILDGGTGRDNLYGGSGDDLYIVRDRNTYIYDESGTDSGQIQVDFYKADSRIEKWTWAPGVEKLPYWIDALLPDDAARYLTLIGDSKTFFYCFPESLPDHVLPEDSNGFRPFTAAQRAFVKQAFAYISSVIDIHFVETTDPEAANTIVLMDNLQSGSSGYAYYPSGSAIGSDLFMDYDGSSARNLSPSEFDYSALTMIHELGHALGMKHPFEHADAVGAAGEGPFLPTAEDTTQWSVMSYNSRSADYHLRYAPLDIAALQYLYGPSTAVQTDTVYQIDAGAPNFIWDGGGTDTIDGSRLAQDLTLYLEPGYWGYAGTKSSLITSAGQITVDFGTVIENANGGSGNDLLVGNTVANKLSGLGGNDSLDGGAGNDILDGGAGRDTVIEHDTRAGFTLARTAAGFTLSAVSGTQGADTLIDIERVRFDDTSLAFDVTGNGGQAYRLYQAAFNRKPDIAGLGFWIDALDKGVALKSVSASFVNSPEFQTLYGTHPSNGEILTAFYHNVLHRVPDQDGYNWWMGQMATGDLTVNQMLVDFSESPENQAQVIGSIQNGIEYTVFG